MGHKPPQKASGIGSEDYSPFSGSKSFGKYCHFSSSGSSAAELTIVAGVILFY